MSKIMTVEQEKCTGCRLCEMACSVKQEGVSDPSRARIRVIELEEEASYLPLFCQHCDEPLCTGVCPVNAIQRDDSLWRFFVDQDLCVGCRACVSVCTLGGVGFDEKGRKVLRCDLCGGDPSCVKFCVPRAIQFVDRDKVQIKKKGLLAERFSRALKLKDSCEEGKTI